jgi:hypothetical protein
VDHSTWTTRLGPKFIYRLFLSHWPHTPWPSPVSSSPLSLPSPPILNFLQSFCLCIRKWWAHKDGDRMIDWVIHFIAAVIREIIYNSGRMGYPNPNFPGTRTFGYHSVQCQFMFCLCKPELLKARITCPKLRANPNAQSDTLSYLHRIAFHSYLPNLPIASLIMLTYIWLTMLVIVLGWIEMRCGTLLC